MQIDRVEINSGWKFRQQEKNEWLPAKIPGCVHTDLLYNKKIDDPFYRTNEKKLQWIDKVNWEYQTTFNLTSKVLNKSNHRLVFDGLDTYADIYLNGEKILDANNMFRTWHVDVDKELLKTTNNLHIIFCSPVWEDAPKFETLEYRLPAINDQSEVGGLGEKKISIFARKAPYHYGWDWGPRFVTMGIWRPVHLLSWNNVIIESVHYHQHEVNEKIAKISAIIEITSDLLQKLKIKISDKINETDFVEQAVTLEEGTQLVTIPFEIKNPRLWWCNGLGEPHLYLFNVEILSNNKIIDKKETEIGLRKIIVRQEKDEKGSSFYFELNGVPVFAKGSNYIPNDNFVTRVTIEKYEHIIKSAVDANMNMLRVWGGGIYENDIFYKLCNQNGILIWQDFMFSCSMYPGDEDFLSNVQKEIIDNVKRLRNHACIAIWCGNNENDMIWFWPEPVGWKNQFNVETANKLWADYKKLFYNLIPGVLNKLDPDRFYWPSSPLAGYDERASYVSTSGDMHYWGVWHSKEPFDKFKMHIARFMSEFGFQSFPELSTVRKYTIPEDWDIDSEVMAAHQRSGIGNQRIKMYMDWDYHLPNTFSDMLYLSQVLQAEGIKIAMEAHRRSKPYCMGSLYWQINDCWPVASWSSIDYFGRWKALHYFAKKAFAPVLISPSFDDGIVRVFINSDRLDPLNCKVEFRLMDFNGKTHWQAEKDIHLEANGNNVIFESPLNKIIEEEIKNQVVLYCTCTKNEIVLSENCLYFDKVKELELPKPNITVDVDEISTGYQIKLFSNALVKNLYISLDDNDAHFSDNYFDLLPDKKIMIQCWINSKIKSFKDKLKIISIYDTYH